jgi:hypothetical protein
MYWLSLSPQFQNATYLGDIEIKINNSLDVATIGNTTYMTLGQAVAAATGGSVIKLLSSTTENISLTTAVSIDFNGFTLDGDLSVVFDDEATITFSGFGILTGDLTVNAPNLTLNTNLTIAGSTNIIAVANSSFNTSGVHSGGISVQGPGRINATNETVRPNIVIATTAAIIIEGFVKEVSVSVDDAVIEVNAVVQRLSSGGRPLQVTLGSAAQSSIQNLIKNVDQNRYYSTIQDAIDAANQGDTIHVGAGLYSENLAITKAISIVSTNLHNATIDGYININSSNVTVSGFLISPQSNATISSNLALILITLGSNINILDNVIGRLTYELPGDKSQLRGDGGIKAIHISNANTETAISSVSIIGNTIEDIEFNESESSSTPNAFSVSYGELFGVFIQGNVSNVIISGNAIQNLSSSGFTNAIYLNQTRSISPTHPDFEPRNIEIVNNRFENLSANRFLSFGIRVEVNLSFSENNYSITENQFKQYSSHNSTLFVTHLTTNASLSVTMDSIESSNEFFENAIDLKAEATSLFVLSSDNQNQVSMILSNTALDDFMAYFPNSD